MKKGRTHIAAATNDKAFNSLIPPISAASACDRLILPKLISIAPKAITVPVMAEMKERQGVCLEVVVVVVVVVIALISGEQVKHREQTRNTTAVMVRTEPRTRVKSASITNRLVFRIKKRASGRSANSKSVDLHTYSHSHYVEIGVIIWMMRRPSLCLRRCYSNKSNGAYRKARHLLMPPIHNAVQTANIAPLPAILVIWNKQTHQ